MKRAQAFRGPLMLLALSLLLSPEKLSARVEEPREGISTLNWGIHSSILESMLGPEMDGTL